MSKLSPAMRSTLAPKSLFAVSLVLALRILTETSGADETHSPLPLVENFNRGWTFTNGDVAGAEAAGFDDAGWLSVRLPHDWAIAGPFNAAEPGHTGKLPWKGVGWYRKTFTLDAAYAGNQVDLDFDGVMAFPKIYINGQLAGEWDYGYTSFRIDATKFVKFGEPNSIAVRVDTTKHGSRWYPGAGIYRKVTLVVKNPIHISQWGTFITTPEASDESAKINVRTTIENDTDQAASIGVDVMVLDPDGTLSAACAVGSDEQLVPAHGTAEVNVPLTVANPKRWDIENPQLYEARTTVRIGDKVVDAETTPFGIRTAEFTADDGFHLNGRRVQLQGVCLHHDHGPLGAAFYPRAMERQLEIMREMGVNAIRTSHNPPAPELLALCDRMGFVVWDECFDKWNETADRINGQPALEAYGDKHIRSLVLRDRNHPSVVVWSIGNEIPEQPRDPEGLSPQRVALLRELVRKYDDTRPVGLAHNDAGSVFNSTVESLDVIGWNYSRRYMSHRERYPNKPIVYSESASALSTRGFYELPLPRVRYDLSPQKQVSSYDFNATRWSDIADVDLDLMERDKFVAGEFVWTGFDYLGEPTPYEREASSSYFGIVDTCGIPKDRFYLYRSHWRPDTATVHILPHWNWPERVGQPVPVFVYTNGDSAELLLNGRSLGRREKVSAHALPVNIAQGKPATASSNSSSEGDAHPPNLANDGDGATQWAADSDIDQWWQVDLGSVQPIADVIVNLEYRPGRYHYRVDVSDDGENWKAAADYDQWFEGWGINYHGLNTTGRFLRITFLELSDGARAALPEFSVYRQSYYAVVDKYRLRWMDVAYEPGELKAVAYKDGKKIGEAVMRTAGPPAAIRLTPDRTTLAASGEDLGYCLVEALDADGNLCPLADNLVEFEVDGPATIAGVGNGNPLSLEPYQADHRKLFFGKAMLILRTDEGQGGSVRITATSDGLKPAAVMVECRP